MALGQLAPWLNINTQEWGNLAARGAQLDIERQRLAEEVQERKAADSLRRDQLQFNRQDAQTQNQQAAAALALRQAALKQGGLLGQEKIDQSGQTAAAKLAAVSGHYANEAAHWGNQDQSATDKNQTAADALAAKTAAANANPPKMSFADQEKLKHLYALLTDAQVKFNAINSQKDPDGALKAVNKINTFQKQIAEMTAPMAGSTLQAGTPNPTPAAIAYLRANPNLASAFDAKYGQGLAAQKLAQ
jgi:hypothetical protein